MKYNLQHIKIDVSDSPNIDNLKYMSEKPMAAHPRQTNLALLVKKCFEINVIFALCSCKLCSGRSMDDIISVYYIHVFEKN